LPKIVPFMR